jgi:hypothetical protein
MLDSNPIPALVAALSAAVEALRVEGGATPQAAREATEDLLHTLAPFPGYWTLHDCPCGAGWHTAGPCPACTPETDR